MDAHAQDGPWACTRQPRSRGGSEVHPWQAACPAVLPLTQPVAAPPPGRGWNAGREEAWKRTRTGPELVSMGLVCGLHPRVIRAVEGLGHSSPGEERIVPPVTSNVPWRFLSKDAGRCHILEIHWEGPMA